MDHIPIAELRPELPALESKHIKAVVSLLWPYSSSTRQFALLLTEPDFRLRLKKGQARVRFTRSCAKAIAATGIGIGDTVILGLQGAQFVEKDAEVQTPGRSIDWELSFSQTLIVQIFRGGNEIANLDIVNAAPTPARSPVRQKPFATPRQTPLKNPGLLLGDAPQWSSPAFLKRSRLSDGTFFEPAFDPLAQDVEDIHDKKRRRKSYKDWNVWTYAKRTPSPEKDDPAGGDLANSPIRLPSLPVTPVSPNKPQLFSEAGLPIEPHEELEVTGGQEEVGSQTGDDGGDIRIIETEDRKEVEWKGAKDDFVRDADYYSLYAGPDEVPPSETQYAYDGDTEPNTEEEEDETEDSAEAQEVIEILSATDAASDASAEEGSVQEDSLNKYKVVSDLDSSEAAFEHGTIVSSTEEDSFLKVVEDSHENEVAVGSGQELPEREQLGAQDDPVDLDGDSLVVMPPPPKLSFLQTDFAARVPEMLTPIGKEPQSVALKPLDSSTLPMPSPFPGDRDGQSIPFLDRSPLSQQPVQFELSAVEELEPSSDASYIVESSFYNSVSAANSRSNLPNHDSVFTDVRFTFGMDGSAFSRQTLHSEPLESQDVAMEDDVSVAQSATEGDNTEYGNDHDLPRKEEENDVTVKEEDEGVFSDGVSLQHPDPISKPQFEHELIVLSSDSVSEAHDNESEPDSESGEEVEVASAVEEGGYNVGNDDDLGEHLARGAPARVSIERENGESQAVPIAVLEEETPFLEDEHLVPEDEHSSPPSNIQRPAVTTDIIDLGSGSEDDSDEDLPVDKSLVVLDADSVGDHMEYHDNNSPSFSVIVPPGLHDQAPGAPERGHEIESAALPENLRESASTKTAHDVLTTVTAADDGQHLPTNLTLDQMTAFQFSDDVSMTSSDDKPLLQMGDHDDGMLDAGPDVGSTQGTTQEAEAEMPETIEDYADIKIESVEDNNLFQGHLASSRVPDDDESMYGPSAELMIPLPEEGSKVGELKYTAVAATGPARNTRSRTKPSMSPIKDQTYVPRQNTRSRRSKTSITSITQVSQSPFDSILQSTVSPAKDAMPASPYSLRSQSKILSPDRSFISPNVTIGRGSQSHRKRRGRQDQSPLSSPLADSFGEPEQGRFLIDFPDTDGYQPSQELGDSKSGKFTNLLFVKDSEEGSLHSEHSITTGSDDSEGFRMPDFSDLVEPVTQLRDGDPTTLEALRTLRESSPNTREPPQARTLWKASQEESMTSKVKTPPQPNNSSIADNVLSSPTKMSYPRIPASISPQKTRKHVSGLSSDSQADDSATPKALLTAGQVAYPDLSLEGEAEQFSRSSSPLAELDEWIRPVPLVRAEIKEHIPSSPPPAQLDSAFPSVIQHPLVNSNMPVTPNATQQIFVESQPAFSVGQQELNMPMTPQLTQTTSAGLRDLKADQQLLAEVKTEEVSRDLKGQPFSLRKSTPRRNTTTTDVASPSRSPSVHSEDVSDSEDEATLVGAKLESPSIGLSTPVSYYTPLRDLRYFLNRSSQFVSSSNPDILALVTSSSSLPKKADKGPKHWNTTFSITDLSSHPTTTTVTVFRPYANALPVAEQGDVVLLRAFQVKSLNRQAMLRSGEESAWCVWRYGKPVWGMQRGGWGDVKAREEVRGPEVEHGEGEWVEVDRLRGWWVGTAKGELERKEGGNVNDKGKVVENDVGADEVQEENEDVEV